MGTWCISGGQDYKNVAGVLQWYRSTIKMHGCRSSTAIQGYTNNIGIQ